MKVYIIRQCCVTQVTNEHANTDDSKDIDFCQKKNSVRVTRLSWDIRLCAYKVGSFWLNLGFHKHSWNIIHLDNNKCFKVKSNHSKMSSTFGGKSMSRRVFFII